MAGYGPARPPNERDLLMNVNGSFRWLGVLISDGTLAVDNATTTTPFFRTPTNPQWATTPGASLGGTLAGKSLLLAPLSAGFIATSSLPMPAAGVAPTNGTLVVATTVTAPTAAQLVGLPLVTSERAGPFFLLPTEGWLQWLSSGGAGNCHVYEAF